MTNGKTVSTEGNAPNASWRKAKFEHWRSLGVGLLPLYSEPAEKRKMPAIDTWKPYLDNPAQSELLDEWANTSTNYGIIIGNNLVVFDFESFEAADKAFASLGLKDSDIYAVKTGKGIHAYFRRNYAIKPQRYHDSTGTLVVEIRAGAQYVVGAGSKHPSGVIYEEIGLEEPTELAEADFQKFNDAFVQLGWNGSGKKADDEKPAIAPRTDGIVPLSIKKTIELGAAKGSGRNDARFVLLLNLTGTGVPLDKAKEMLLQYNRNSDEPDDDAKVIAQVEQVYQGCKDGSYKPIVPEGKEKPVHTGGLDMVSADDLMTMEFSENNWIVEKLVPEEGITILGGKRSCNKTWFALGAALAITRGEPFLSNFKTIQKSVVYIDAENGRSQIKKRLKMLTEVEKFPGLDFMFFPSLKLDEGNEELHKCLSARPGAVVIIDSFRRVLGVDENDASAVNSMLVGALRPLVEECRATFILLHHLRKGSGRGVQDHLDELRGSSELVNYADSVVLMERLRANPNLVTVRHAKSRTGVEVPPFRLEVASDDDSFRFDYLGSFEDTESKPELAGKAIEKWLFDNKKTEFKTSEVTEALKPEFTPKSISRALAWLVKGGKITKPSRGKYALVASSLSHWVGEADGTTDTSTNICPVVPSQQERDATTQAGTSTQKQPQQPIEMNGQMGQTLYTVPSFVPSGKPVPASLA